jgi:hypothetical protein
MTRARDAVHGERPTGFALLRACKMCGRGLLCLCRSVLDQLGLRRLCLELRMHSRGVSQRP